MVAKPNDKSVAMVETKRKEFTTQQENGIQPNYATVSGERQNLTSNVLSMELHVMHQIIIWATFLFWISDFQLALLYHFKKERRDHPHTGSYREGMSQTLSWAQIKTLGIQSKPWIVQQL